MKKRLLAIPATLALLAGGVFAASAANAVGGKLTNYSGSNCVAQYKKPGSATVFSISPGTNSINAVNQFRIPIGCHGQGGNGAGFGMVAGQWYSFASYDYGTGVTVYSYQGA